MESSKVVLTILFAGQQRRGRHRERTLEHREGRRGWGDSRE